MLGSRAPSTSCPPSPSRRSSDLIELDELYLTTSIGVAMFPADGDDAETLIRHADGAMYRVKEAGGHNVALSSSGGKRNRSEEHTSELQSRLHLGWRPAAEQKKAP